MLIVRHAGVAITVLLGLACYRQWRTGRSAAAAWVAVAFGSLAAISVAGMVWPNLFQEGGSGWLLRALVGVLVAFPWFLYRFASALEGVSRRLDRFIDLSTVVLVAALAVVPYLPAETEAQPTWWVVYRVAATAQWLFLFLFVGWRLWRAGRGQPEVARRRMRTLALSTALMSLSVLLGPLAPQDSATVLAFGLRSLSLVSVILLFVGFVPPQWVLHAWRRRDYQRIQTVMGGLLRADSPEALAEVMLRPCAAMAGARAAALIDPVGSVIGTIGTIGLVDDPDVHRIEMSSGALILWMSPYTPFFGESELAMFEGLGTFVDIAFQRCTLSEAKRESAAALAFQATHDALTGLPNRTYLMTRLEEELRDSRRSGPIALHFLDLDRFKVVNDGIDHSAGDALLVEVAGRLSGCVRGGDVIARFGGDEFVVVSRVTDHAEALLMAERLATCLQRPIVLGGRELITTASVGVVVTTDKGADPEALIRDADTAMYEAKALGRARVVLFDESLRERSLQRLELERELRAAVSEGSLDLHYQPEVRLEDGAAIAVEALFRWHHPRLGLVHAGTLISLAEESDLIGAVGWWVLREACRQGAEWMADIPSCEDLRIWVNVSPAQFGHRDVAADVKNALAESGLPPRNLGLEITETVFIEHTRKVTEVFEELRALGVAVAIDDFGTGYSSLGAMKRFPADILKIDGSFVDGVANDPHDEAIVAAAIALGQAMGMSVVAEKVETEQQRGRLIEMGCHTAQGFRFAPPLPAAQAAVYLRNHPANARKPVLTLTSEVAVAG